MSSMSFADPANLRAGVRARVAAGLTRSIYSRLIAQDLRAAQRGWAVTAGKWGSRTYRDPRFDSVVRYAETGESAASSLGITVVPAASR